MKNIKLSELFDVQIGLVVSRKAVDFTEQSNNINYSKYKVLSLKSFLEDNTISADFFNEIYTENIMDEKYLTKENDIIVRLINPLKSFVVTKDLENIVVPSQFVKLRNNKSSNILSEPVINEYVSIFLNTFSNTKKMQQYKKEDTWLVNSIKQSTISDIDIPVINLEKQKEIVEFYKLLNKEIKLYKSLIEKKEEFYKSFLQNLIGEK
ncbi:restriction endonuclease subunit S [Candidatus Ruminimicrobium bovinum]|uniref:restriction endonuclease subunit S n=1 Tax=Candidatus Ruminimicrobium bovinum TaxID=3242779 RepID=UPI0039B96516